MSSNRLSVSNYNKIGLQLGRKQIKDFILFYKNGITDKQLQQR